MLHGLPSIPRSKGFTYFIQMGSDGPIKIGQARDPWLRMERLQACSPYKLHMRLVVPGANREREFHARFAFHRMNGEWFAAADELLEFIRETVRTSPVIIASEVTGEAYLGRTQKRAG